MGPVDGDAGGGAGGAGRESQEAARRGRDIERKLAQDPDFRLDAVDQAEELAASYGCTPFEVLRWPWVKHREVWKSFEKRSRRRFKLDALLRGADPLSGASAALGGAASAPRATTDHPVYQDWESAVSRKPQTWYESPDHGERQPTDKDNWDIPDGELMRLSMAFPGMVQIRKT